jgi:hypothetical protein
VGKKKREKEKIIYTKLATIMPRASLVHGGDAKTLRPSPLKQGFGL